jgi:hypothetical protein
MEQSAFENDGRGGSVQSHMSFLYWPYRCASGREVGHTYGEIRARCSSLWEAYNTEQLAWVRAGDFASRLWLLRRLQASALPSVSPPGSRGWQCSPLRGNASRANNCHCVIIALQRQIASAVVGSGFFYPERRNGVRLTTCLPTLLLTWEYLDSWRRRSSATIG